MLRIYLKLAESTRMLEVDTSGINPKLLLRLDREIGYDYRFNRLLGGSFLVALISGDIL